MSRLRYDPRLFYPLPEVTLGVGWILSFEVTDRGCEDGEDGHQGEECPGPVCRDSDQFPVSMRSFWV